MRIQLDTYVLFTMEDSIYSNWVVNLRALSKNSKKKIDKTSGRKQPRVNDYEIEFEPVLQAILSGPPDCPTGPYCLG